MTPPMAIWRSTVPLIGPALQAPGSKVMTSATTGGRNQDLRGTMGATGGKIR